MWQVRLKVKDWFSVRLLPNQVFKINKRWQLGNSPVALRVNYECPLNKLDDPFRAPARLMIRCAQLATQHAMVWFSKNQAGQKCLHPLDIGSEHVVSILPE